MEPVRQLDVARECRCELNPYMNHARKQGYTREQAVLKACLELMQAMFHQRREMSHWRTQYRMVREQGGLSESEETVYRVLVKMCSVEILRIDQKIAFFNRLALGQC